MGTVTRLPSTDFTTRLRDLPDAYLDCRDPGLRHPWIKDDTFALRGPQRGGTISDLERRITCGRCGAIKTEHFRLVNGRLVKIGTSYAYPDGYLLPGVVQERKPGQIVLAEQFRRAREAGLVEVAL